MPVFKYDDWFSLNIGLIARHTSHLLNKPIEILEIGCFEGRSTMWLLDRFNQARITSVDSFEGGEEHEGIDFNQVYENFLRNSEGKEMRLVRDSSANFFRFNPLDIFDFAFIDGSHRASDVLQDLVGCYSRLKNGGIIVADDYMWAGFPDEPHRTPKLAIDSFIACFKGKIEVLEIEYSVAMKKLA